MKKKFTRFKGDNSKMLQFKVFSLWMKFDNYYYFVLYDKWMEVVLQHLDVTQSRKQGTPRKDRNHYLVVIGLAIHTPPRGAMRSNADFKDFCKISRFIKKRKKYKEMKTMYSMDKHEKFILYSSKLRIKISKQKIVLSSDSSFWIDEALVCVNVWVGQTRIWFVELFVSLKSLKFFLEIS